MRHILFIHSSLDGHLGCFHVLPILNSDAVNTGVHVSFRIMVFSGCMPTPVFLPGESQGQRSLVGCRLWGRTESDTTEAT